MSDIKKKLMETIETKAKQKQELRNEIALRHNNVETFVIKFINDMEDMVADTASTNLLAPLVDLYKGSLEAQIKVIDPHANIEIKWIDSGSQPRINGILIKWSKDYQEKNNSDEQLFIDATSLLFV